VSAPKLTGPQADALRAMRAIDARYTGLAPQSWRIGFLFVHATTINALLRKGLAKATPGGARITKTGRAALEAT
jgi:hypothetical protein